MQKVFRVIHFLSKKVQWNRAFYHIERNMFCNDSMVTQKLRSKSVIAKANKRALQTIYPLWIHCSVTFIHSILFQYAPSIDNCSIFIKSNRTLQCREQYYCGRHKVSFMWLANFLWEKIGKGICEHVSTRVHHPCNPFHPAWLRRSSKQHIACRRKKRRKHRQDSNPQPNFILLLKTRGCLSPVLWYKPDPSHSAYLTTVRVSDKHTLEIIIIYILYI